MSQPWRAKLYSLRSDGSWEDVAMGFVTAEAGRLQMRQEYDLTLVIDVDVNAALHFAKQSMIITWESKDGTGDLGLSFEDQRGCDDIWKIVDSFIQKSVADKDNSPGGGSQVGQKTTSPEMESKDTELVAGRKRHRSSWGSETDDIEASRTEPTFSQLDYQNQSQLQRSTYLDFNPLAEDSSVLLDSGLLSDIAMPSTPLVDSGPDGAGDASISPHFMTPIESINLDNVTELMPVLHRAMRREAARGEVVEYLTQKNNMRLLKFMDLFDEAETGMEQYATQLQLFGAFGVNLLAMNESGVVEQLLADNCFMRFLGMLEHGLGVQPLHFRVNIARTDRQYVAGVDDEHLRMHLHKYFRLSFLRDHVLPRNFDEAVVATLNSIAFFLSTGILRDVVDKHSVSMVKLLEMLSTSYSSPTGEEDSPSPREVAILTLLEYCNMSRLALAQQKSSFIRLLIDDPIPAFRALQPALSDRMATRREVLAALEIISFVCQNEAGALRCYAVREKRTTPDALQDPPSAPILGTGVDDGYSIRLAERLESLGHDISAPTLEMTRLCIDNLPFGEHGLLIQGVDRYSPLLLAVLWRLVDDPDIGVQTLCFDILAMLLHTETSSTEDKDAMLILWYENFARFLTAPFCHPRLTEIVNADGRDAMALFSSLPVTSQSSASSGSLLLPLSRQDAASVVQLLGNGFERGQVIFGKESAASKHSKLLVLDLIHVSMDQHGYRFKYSVMKSDIIHKCCRLARYSEQHVLLACIRLLKRVMTMNDPFFQRFATKHNLPSVIVAILLRTRGKDNLVSSSVLETMASLQQAKSKDVWEDFLSTFNPLMQKLFEVAWVRELLKVDRPTLAPPPLPTSSGRQPQKSLLDEDEKYFESDDDSPVPAPPSAGIVDEFEFVDEFMPPHIVNRAADEDDFLSGKRTSSNAPEGFDTSPSPGATARPVTPSKKFSIMLKTPLD